MLFVEIDVEVRFSGSFLAPDGLEDALLASGGVVQLHIAGIVDLGGAVLDSPSFSAVMLSVPEPTTGVLFLAGAFTLHFQRRHFKSSTTPD